MAGIRINTVFVYVYLYVVYYVTVYFWVYPGSYHAGDVLNILSCRRAKFNVTIAYYYLTRACAARGKAIGLSIVGHRYQAA